MESKFLRRGARRPDLRSLHGVVAKTPGGIIPFRRAASFRYDGRNHLVLLGGFVRNQQAQRIDELTPWAWKARVEAAAQASTAAAA